MVHSRNIQNNNTRNILDRIYSIHLGSDVISLGTGGEIMIEEKIRDVLALEEQTGMSSEDIIALMQVEAIKIIGRKII